MKKRYAILLVILSIALLIAISGCKRECKVNSDCQKASFTGVCEGRTCEYTPIPGVCGNGIKDAGENECTCPADYGSCAGPVIGSTLLRNTCVNDKCIVDVPSSQVLSSSSTNTLRSQGASFKVTGTFNQPFNFKKDTLDIRTTLDILPTSVTNVIITGYEFTVTDVNRQTVVLADMSTNRPLVEQGSFVAESIQLTIPGNILEGSYTNPQITVDLEMTIISGTTSVQKTGQLVSKLRGVTFGWVNPNVQYDCPESCDDGNPGTQDSCGPETNFFCKHTPIAGQCGNFVCDSNENKCTCAIDCGTCPGSAGQFMSLECEKKVCVANLRSGITPIPASIFDDRNLNIFHLQNNFIYNNPLNVLTEKVRININLFNRREDISNVKIENVRLLDRSLQVGFVNVNKGLSAIGQTITVEVPITGVASPEAQHSVSATVAYSYVRDGKPLKGTFTKSLDKITFVTPGEI